jgi:hypothetical protein
MLEYFLERCPKDYAKRYFQKVGLLHIVLELRGQIYQTPFYADCTLKNQENSHEIYFSVDNSCSFKVTSKSNISKQIYKEDK